MGERGCVLMVLVAALGACDRRTDEPARAPPQRGDARPIANVVVTPDAPDPDRDQPPGSWERVGHAGDWRNTAFAVVQGDALFSIEAGDPRLWKTQLHDGRWAAIGKAEFGRTVQLVATADWLYSIEQDGNLFAIDPRAGTWRRIGDKPAWKGTRVAAALGDHLYTIETGRKALYRTTLATGAWDELGTADFSSTKHLLGANNALVAIDGDGSLFAVELARGKRTRIGEPGAWKAAVHAAVLGEHLYTIESDGSLWKTALATGERAAIGNRFAPTRVLAAGAKRLFTIEADGSLYRVWP